MVVPSPPVIFDAPVTKYCQLLMEPEIQHRQGNGAKLYAVAGAANALRQSSRNRRDSLVRVHAIYLSNTRLACPWYLLEDLAEMRVLLLARPDHPADANNAR